MRDALDFPVRTVAHFTSGHTKRGLDLGCAVGRSTFEMARECDEVIGIDFSHAFIGAAETLRKGNQVSYQRVDEASQRTPLFARLPHDVRTECIRFQQGDAMHLPPDLGVFERLHAANLVCRLPQPELLLERLPSLVSPGGELVLATPCTWLDEFTPRENWPTGSTFEWLKASLASHFELLHSCEEPFLIRETARKFQWTFSQVSVWRRSGHA
jgi:putative 4-mercaptohistidine N1-methyltranferase